MHELEEELREIVTNDYSGGVKLTELITNEKLINKPQWRMGGIELTNTILKIVKLTRGLECLEYSWHMGHAGTNRAKFFIYTT